jgi:predicted Zn-dependent peptidase
MSTSVKTFTASPVRDISYHALRLDNGLLVLLHEDRRLPRVVVNVLYCVGSAHDPPSRAGLAHLFEHLMFMGTRRVPEGAFDLAMESSGGWNNAFTGEDVTVYYDVGPARLLPRLLWLEADRMASMASGVTPRKLALQRDVVINELWQEYLNAPYGTAALKLPRLLYPPRHPYRWPVIGSERTISAIGIGDVRRHFARYYVPANAALVIAGDFEPRRAGELVKRYFGSIPSGTPPDPLRLSAPRLSAPVAREVKDRVELPRLNLAWHSPAHFDPGDAEMDLLGDILASGKQSRLHRRLVHDSALAVRVEAYQESRHHCSVFGIEVTGRTDCDRERLIHETDCALRALVDRAPSRREVRRARNSYLLRATRGLQCIERRAELLNLYRASTGDPGAVNRDMQRYAGASSGSIHRWARRVLARPRVEQWVVPR